MEPSPLLGAVDEDEVALEGSADEVELLESVGGGGGGAGSTASIAPLSLAGGEDWAAVALAS
ncbi:MAG TPA: hypothetical protein VJ204_19535, partial [Solirubrobacterales bacterium]|nr:hypothetical protein [Solirubrobacterales bacterium]